MHNSMRPRGSMTPTERMAFCPPQDFFSFVVILPDGEKIDVSKLCNLEELLSEPDGQDDHEQARAVIVAALPAVFAKHNIHRVRTTMTNMAVDEYMASWVSPRRMPTVMMWSEIK